MLVGRSAPRPDRDTLLPLLRWLILGAALGLCVLALSRANAVDAQAPADCIPINQTSCLSKGVIYTNGAPTANIGLPNSTVVPGYAVPVIANPYFGASIAANYFSPFLGVYPYSFIESNSYLGTNCDPKAWWCLNYEYTGNVFANLFLPPSTGAAVPSTPAPAPSPGVIYRPAEVAQPTAPVAAPQAVPAPAAPAAQMATALNAPAQIPTVAPTDSVGITIMSVPTTTAPAANNDGRDDGRDDGR